MANPACEWVRGRLPLCLGAGDDANDPGDEGGDLSVEDRRSIDRHLGTCPACRSHRSGLARTMETLGVAAASLPAVPDAPSLWPLLERRIAAHPERHDSRTTRGRDGATERERICATLDGERPLRSAWMQDTLREGLEAAGLGALSGRTGTARRGRSGGSARVLQGRLWIVGASLAASVLAMLVVLPESWRRQTDAEATILANAKPVAGLIAPPARPQSESPGPTDPRPADDRGIPAGQLAQADPIRPPAEPAPAADASAGAKSGAPTRFIHDLDPATPMPPDGRDAKPVY